MRVTIFSGFLGAGKTTLLRRLVRETSGRRLGVIVNDMSELEVDGDLVRTPDSLNEELGNFASIHSGSISGDQRSAFAAVLEEWRTREDLDHVIVETSGSTHPWPLIEEITSRKEYVLDAFVTLIDARAFVEDFDGGGGLLTSSQPHAGLMLAQLQLADVALLTKTEKLSAETIQRVAAMLNVINAEAALYAVSYGKIKPELLLNCGRFSLKRAKNLSVEWRGVELGEAATYDIGSTVVSDVRPLHPMRLWKLFRERLGAGIHRSKGFIWLSSRDRDVLVWQQAAGSVELELTAYWKAALVKNPDGNLTPNEVESLSAMLESGHSIFGDRACEVTIIGAESDRAVFVPEFINCFCTEEEIQHWLNGGRFDDPWPKTLRMI